ncbi:nuclear ribonuclease Z isoform X1 [Prunus yedoensis var. nudiflora]|uniref:Nuclear ribonuclease Z isoform X1 n=1 Tax=Prunus yedoensis var. nudiflora TaxID=2094558 RepID=A0A314YY24_PRUYE|nr:nuclear ribonuclease Z isoform X1 [Prunus yedoensis var. nudiflora]
MSDFITDSSNIDVLKANILVVESTFVDDSVKVEHAREYGHMHLSEIISHAEKFENKAILLIHFSARYTVKEIEQAVSVLLLLWQAEFLHLQKVFDGKPVSFCCWFFIWRNSSWGHPLFLGLIKEHRVLFD